MHTNCGGPTGDGGFGARLEVVHSGRVHELELEVRVRIHAAGQHEFTPLVHHRRSRRRLQTAAHRTVQLKSDRSISRLQIRIFV